MTDVVKHIPNPEPWVLRAQLVAKARREPPTQCPHPVSAVDQYIDEEPGRAGRPTNLFQCTICSRILRLVDYHGKEARDG